LIEIYGLMKLDIGDDFRDDPCAWRRADPGYIEVLAEVRKARPGVQSSLHDVRIIVARHQVRSHRERVHGFMLVILAVAPALPLASLFHVPPGTRPCADKSQPQPWISTTDDRAKQPGRHVGRTLFYGQLRSRGAAAARCATQHWNSVGAVSRSARVHTHNRQTIGDVAVGPAWPPFIQATARQ
jgi:hypothetical protein